MVTGALLLPLALLLDWVLGEPRRAHPLVGFGRLVRRLERGLHADTRARGLLAVALLILPAGALAALALRGLPPLAASVLDVALLVFALGHRSLHDHAWPIAAALEAGDETQARQLAARIVSRDASALEPAPAAVESVLENGADGVFGTLFWFLVAGGTGALVHRLANTLDAMWGYRSARYARFGWAAARLDDVLNWPVARLTALSYALLGDTRRALRCWREQAANWDSPNAGPVMAAGAGALRLHIGGPARYDGAWHARPWLGQGPAASAADIGRALALVRRGALLWSALAALGGGATWMCAHA